MVVKDIDFAVATNKIYPRFFISSSLISANNLSVLLGSAELLLFSFLISTFMAFKMENNTNAFNKNLITADKKLPYLTAPQLNLEIS